MKKKFKFKSLVFSAIMIYFIYMFVSQWILTYKISNKINVYSNQLNKLKSQNQELKNELNEYKKDPDSYAEKIAREKFKLIKPGETIIKNASKNH